MELPLHQASLTLIHNDHKNCYETVEQWCSGWGDNPFFDWVSEAERLKAIAIDSVWTLQWYPDNPVGFYALAASSLEALLQAAKSTDRGQKT